MAPLGGFNPHSISLSRRSLHVARAACLPAAATMAIAAQVINEVRGAVLALPVMVAMYESGGTGMAVWLGICSIAGIALSVFAPCFAIHFIRRRWSRNTGA